MQPCYILLVQLKSPLHRKVNICHLVVMADASVLHCMFALQQLLRSFPKLDTPEYTRDAPVLQPLNPAPFLSQRTEE